MKRYLAAVSFLLTLCALPLYAAEKPPVGMEYKKIGDARVLVPKGTRMRKEGDLNVVEDISEYSSRRFVEMDASFAEDRERLGKLESGQKAIEEELAKLKAELELLRETKADRPSAQ